MRSVTYAEWFWAEIVPLHPLPRAHGMKSIKANGKTSMYTIHDARLDLPEAP